MTTDAGRPVIVPRPFYDRPCLTVAEELVGKVLARALDGVVWRGRIVETEGYVGEEDQACHAARGPTPRNQVMYGPPGVSYVYFVYGMHHCFNAVCEREGFPAAVLIRALEPLTNGITATDGPAKLCRALAITRRESGLDLTRGEAIWIENHDSPAPRVATTPRIGIDYAGTWARKKWRFVDRDSCWLSKPLPKK